MKKGGEYAARQKKLVCFLLPHAIGHRRIIVRRWMNWFFLLMNSKRCLNNLCFLSNFFVLMNGSNKTRRELVLNGLLHKTYKAGGM